MEAASLCELQGDGTFRDRISNIPDEILISIASRLPINEAGRTSVLLTRWQNLWKFSTILNFDAAPDLAKAKYVRWVDEVMRLHQRPTVEGFKIKFKLDASDGSHIDEWMKLMLRKKPKRITIDLIVDTKNSRYRPSPECCEFIRSPLNLSNISRLTSLSLAAVNVGGEFVEYLLSNFPHLEILSITFSLDLFRLQVTGPNLPLKYLKIDACIWLQRLELSAPNLVAFEYQGLEIEFIIGNNPLLSQAFLYEQSRS